MLSLMILVGLGLWVLFAIGTVYFGRKLGLKYYKTARASKLGAFLGFMLTMGGFIVYWTVEYIVIQQRVNHLCNTEAGVKIYVTPEQWREEIGEEEWKTLQYIGESVNFSNRDTIYFQGKKYIASVQENKLIQSYVTDRIIADNISGTDLIYYDNKNKIVLAQIKAFNVGVEAIANSFEGLKFWIDEIHDCP